MAKQKLTKEQKRKLKLEQQKAKILAQREARENGTDKSIIRTIFGGRPGQDDHIAWWHIWARVLVDFLKKNRSNLQVERSYNFYASSNAIYSQKDNVTYLYTFDGYPSSVAISYPYIFRSRVVGDTRISFISLFEPYTIDWNSSQMESRLRTYAALDDAADEGTDIYSYHKNIKSLDERYWRRQSILYLSEADVKRERQLFRYRRLMIITGKRGDDFDRTVANVERIASGMKLNINRVTRNVKEILQSFSPTSLEFQPKVMSQLGNAVIPDEMLSRFNTYDQGKIGSTGIYMGTDVESGFPIIKQFKKTDEDPENILILAETGWGKSFYVKGLDVQLLANRRVIGTIMDIEGFEYAPLAGFIANNDNVVQLNMAEGQGSYFDPVEIILTGDPDRDEDMFALAKSFTLSLFNTLAGRDVLSLPWTDIIINDAVSEVYSNAGVDPLRYSTWVRSKGLAIQDVYAAIKRQHLAMTNNQGTDYRFTNSDYRRTLDLVRAKIGRYFETLEEGGTRVDVFRNRVTLDQIRDAKLVVCSFGMANKASDTVDPIQMGLTQISAANISHIRSLFAKQRGQFNLKVWEELQRWVDFPGSENILNTSVTGGRKMGDINMIISNNPSMFIGAGDRLGLFNNITSFLIGALPDKIVAEEIATRLSVPYLIPELERLVDEAGSTETFNETTGDASLESPYRRAFLMRLDKAVATIGKMQMPKFVSQSDLFKTGSSEKGDDKDVQQSIG